jgi:hypothetical protein
MVQSMNNLFKNTIQGFVICLLLLTGCRPATEVTATWTNPEAQDINYNNVLVFAITERISVKQTMETALAEELHAQGINASTSMEEFPPRLRDQLIEDKNTLMDIIEGNGYDAILTVAVVDEETETRYVPGTGAMPWAPMGRFGYYGNFWGYYNYWSPFMYDPGYYQEERIYFIETNLYDANTESLVWSAQSETVNPQDLNSFSNQLAEVTADELSEKNFFSPEPTTALRE